MAFHGGRLALTARQALLSDPWRRQVALRCLVHASDNGIVWQEMHSVSVIYTSLPVTCGSCALTSLDCISIYLPDSSYQRLRGSHCISAVSRAAAGRALAFGRCVPGMGRSAVSSVWAISGRSGRRPVSSRWTTVTARGQHAARRAGYPSGRPGKYPGPAVTAGLRGYDGRYSTASQLFSYYRARGSSVNEAFDLLHK